MNNTNALIIGAGASCELAMPLVGELTKEIKDYLTPEKLISLNNNWKKRNCGHVDENIKFVCELLENDNIHYENLIGALQVEKRRTRSNNQKYQDFHGIISWFLDFIYYLLYYRQVRNDKYIKNRLQLYLGIKELCQLNQPLWIFSLNHDLVIEAIADMINIPIKSGFNQDIEIKYKYNGRIKSMSFEYLSRKDIDNNKLNFFKYNENGINLIKLHGSLDIFGKGDELNYLKIKSNNFDGLLSSLHEINENMDYKPNNFKTINEITYLDENNEIQFLKKSLLSGVYKFQDYQIAPKEFLTAFKTNINYADNIYIIGYSFSDSHINQIIKDWVSFIKKRKIIIVDPFPKLPNEFNHLIMQIEIKKSTFADFLIEINNSNNKKELIKKNNHYKRLRKFAKSRAGQLTKKILKNILNIKLLNKNRLTYKKM